MAAAATFSVWRDKARLAFQTDPGDDESEQQPDRLDEIAQYCPQLTFQQRLMGFAISFSLGYLVAFMSFRFFIQLVEGNPIPFALNYCFGHLSQLAASTFLCGPKRQFKVMFDDKRRDTSIVYLSCLGLCLTVVFIPLPGLIKLLLLVAIMLVQCCASIWYSLSYIPYGRRAALRMVKSYLGIEESPASSYNMVMTGAGVTSV